MAPRDLRGGKQVYPDLSKRSFSPEEKILLLEFYNKQLETDPFLSLNKFAQRYNLSGSRVNNWGTTLKRGKNLFAKPGRPLVIDETGLKQCVDEVISLRSEGNPPTFSETTRILQGQANATADRRNQPHHDLTVRTAATYISRAKLNARKPQVTTPARQKACSDHRMLYSAMVMATAFAKGINPQVLWNFDFTTFVIPRAGSGENVYIAEDDNSIIPPAVVDDETLPFAIKWVHLANAAGTCGPLILIVSMDSIPEGQHEVVEIRGLSYNNNSSQSGYIVACHSRNATDEVYRWFLKKIVIPQIIETREYWGLDRKSVV